MNLIEHIPDLTGCFVLTGNGMLGSYHANGGFVLEPSLTSELSELIHGFKSEYAGKRDITRRCLAIIYPDNREQPWRSSTLAFSDAMLRRLYPVHNSARSDALTSFQIHNREKSIFRGLELLLEATDDRALGCARNPRHCPVLISRRVTLADYAQQYGLAGDRDLSAPVIEVVDLLVNAGLEAYANPGVHQLVSAFRGNVLRKKMRAEPTLAMLDGWRTAGQTA